MGTEGTTLNSANMGIKFLLRRLFDDVLRMLPLRLDRRRLDDESRRRGAQHGASQWSRLIDTVCLNKEYISRCMHGRRAGLRLHARAPCGVAGALGGGFLLRLVVEEALR